MNYRNFGLPIAAIVLAATLGAVLLQRAPASHALGDTKAFYVSPSGSDSSSGRAPDRPFQTIQHAIDLAQPGDTINLAAGVYLQDFVSRRGGTESAPITIKGPADAVIKGGGKVRIVEINHDNITLEGFSPTGCGAHLIVWRATAKSSCMWSARRQTTA